MHPTASILAARHADALRRGMPDEAVLLIADITRQCLTVTVKGQPERAYPISTSHLGTGTEENSNRTPTGLHEVVERYGSTAPAGTVFKARVPTGQVLPETEWRGALEEDLILSRILRLAGREPGHNAGNGVDSYDRYIYLHGTNHEDRIGHTSSGGCIRMTNRDIIELDLLTRNRPVWCWIGRLSY